MKFAAIKRLAADCSARMHPVAAKPQLTANSYPLSAARAASSPAEIILSKVPLPTHLDSAEIRSRVAREIRERALFSARMASMQYLKSLQRVLAAYADGQLNAADARLRLMGVLDGLGLGEGSNALTDPGSARRLNLILQTQKQMAASAARVESQDPAILEQWPAWRLTRFGSRRVPREDWLRRWQAAGEAVGWQGAHRRQMVALKSSPVWEALGRGAGGFRDTLGNPYPPFAYGSGMDWEDVSAEEAGRLGLEPDGAQPARASLAPSERDILEAMGRTGLSAKDFAPIANTRIANSRPPFNKCPKCGKFAAFDGSCKSCGHTLSTDQMIQRGREALSRATQGNPRDVKRAMHKPGLGTIHFLQGWEGKGKEQANGKGLAKLQQKHRNELESLPETIAKGKVYRVKSEKTGEFDDRVRAIIYGSKIAFLSRHEGGWALTTHYTSETKAREIEADNR